MTHYTLAPTAFGLLAQDRKGFSTEVMMWLGVIVALAVLLAVVAMALRKRLFRPDDASPIGFTLADLRRMHAEGQLSDEELAQAEAKTLNRSRSHYLGDTEADAADDQDESGGRDDSSTTDPPADPDGAENPGDDPDKNPGGGPVG